jgi:hypothetical protein
MPGSPGWALGEKLLARGKGRLQAALRPATNQTRGRIHRYLARPGRCRKECGRSDGSDRGGRISGNVKAMKKLLKRLYPHIIEVRKVDIYHPQNALNPEYRKDRITRTTFIEIQPINKREHLLAIIKILEEDKEDWMVNCSNNDDIEISFIK